MPKAIYGHSQKKKKASSRGEAEAEDTHGWLTLMTIPLEGQEQLIDSVELLTKRKGQQKPLTTCNRQDFLNQT